MAVSNLKVMLTNQQHDYLRWSKIFGKTEMSSREGGMNHGYEQLWGYFGLSYSSWVTMPRSLMHEMPDDWQAKMAALLEEWDNAWDTHDLPSPYVIAKREDGRFTSWPSWVNQYRHPDRESIAKHSRLNG